MRQQIYSFIETVLLAVVILAGCKIFDMIAGTDTTIQQYTLFLVLLVIFEIISMKRNED